MAMAEKSVSLKFGAAIYYMVASMVVQFVNKVCVQLTSEAPPPPLLHAHLAPPTPPAVRAPSVSPAIKAPPNL